MSQPSPCLPLPIRLRLRAGRILEEADRGTVSRHQLEAQARALDLSCRCKLAYSRVCGHKGEEDCPCEQGRECECVWYAAPCRHLKRAGVGDITLEGWAALLLALEPEEYGEPPPPTVSALALSQEARVELMAQRYDVCVCGRCRRDPEDPEKWAEPRHCHGVGLYHGGDVVDSEGMKVGLLALTTRDGKTVKGRGLSGRVELQVIAPTANQRKRPT